MSAKEPRVLCFQPVGKKRYPIVLGASFTGGREFTAIRYDFKPRSMDQSQAGKLELQGQAATVTYPDTEGSTKEFKGHSQKCSPNEHILWFDNDNERFVLEKLARSVKVKMTSGPSAAADTKKRPAIKKSEKFKKFKQQQSRRKKTKAPKNYEALMKQHPSGMHHDEDSSDEPVRPKKKSQAPETTSTSAKQSDWKDDMAALFDVKSEDDEPMLMPGRMNLPNDEEEEQRQPSTRRVTFAPDPPKTMEPIDPALDGDILTMEDIFSDDDDIDIDIDEPSTDAKPESKPEAKQDDNQDVEMAEAEAVAPPTKDAEPQSSDGAESSDDGFFSEDY